MAIEFSTTLTPSDRNARVVSNPSNFFYLIDVEDINFAVERILEGQDEPSVPRLVGQKYLLKSTYSISVEDSDVNDIVMWDGQKWIIYQKMGNAQFPSRGNSRTQFGLIFDKNTKKFYQYVDATTGWVPILRSGSVDGGTFGQ